MLSFTIGSRRKPSLPPRASPELPDRIESFGEHGVRVLALRE